MIDLSKKPKPFNDDDQCRRIERKGYPVSSFLKFLLAFAIIAIPSAVLWQIIAAFDGTLSATFWTFTGISVVIGLISAVCIRDSHKTIPHSQIFSLVIPIFGPTLALWRLFVKE